MISPTIIVLCMALAIATAAPANNDQLDKATVNDVSANSVSEEAKVIVTPASQSAISSSPVSSVQITGITTGANSPVIPSLPNENTPFKPQRVGSMFARFIDDIFQIPINVLQNVAKLITSPFNTQKNTPQVVATVSS